MRAYLNGYKYKHVYRWEIRNGTIREPCKRKREKMIETDRLSANAIKINSLRENLEDVNRILKNQS